VARVILDTTVLIGVERSRRGLDRLLADEDDVAIAAVTAAELLVGVALADEAHRAHRTAFVASVLDTVPVEDYDLAVARAHAELMVHVRRSGRARGAHDLLIAATARARDRMVVTADRAGFADLPGVPVRSPMP
jgi:tRNA(fMet)-specific endonuclease VapC